jgi:DNA-binding transcriptional regulator WhiA
MTDGMRHNPEARIAPVAKLRIRHRDRSLMMLGHKINKEPVEGRGLGRPKFCDVRRIKQTRH